MENPIFMLRTFTPSARKSFVCSQLLPRWREPLPCGSCCRAATDEPFLSRSSVDVSKVWSSQHMNWIGTVWSEPERRALLILNVLRSPLGTIFLRLWNEVRQVREVNNTFVFGEEISLLNCENGEEVLNISVRMGRNEVFQDNSLKSGLRRENI